MSKVEIELNKKGIRSLLKSNEVKEYVENKAKTMVDADSHMKSFVGYDRANVFIYPNTKRHPE